MFGRRFLKECHQEELDAKFSQRIHALRTPELRVGNFFIPNVIVKDIRSSFSEMVFNRKGHITLEIFYAFQHIYEPDVPEAGGQGDLIAE